MSESTTDSMVLITSEGEDLRAALRPWNLVRRFATHADLIRQLAWREIAARYRGSALGMLWTFLHPLVTLAVYAFALGAVLRIRWGTDPQASPWDFPLLLFCGLIPFSLFSEVLSRAPSLVTANPSYVKRIVFPLEILPVVSLLANLVQTGASLALLVTGAFLLRGASAMALSVLALLVPLVLLTLWVSFLASALGVFVRDLAHAITVLLQVAFFATPIFYPLHLVPSPWRVVVAANPLTPVVEGMRQVLYAHGSPDWTALGAWTAAHLALLLGALYFFLKSKRAFPDVT